MFNKIKGFFIKSGEVLKTIDFMGPEFEFEDDNSSKFKSVSGFCFSFSCSSYQTTRSPASAP